MYDPYGRLRMVVPRMRIWMADYPEQVMLSRIISGMCVRCDAGTDGAVGMGSLTGAVTQRDLRAENEQRELVESGRMSVRDFHRQAGIQIDMVSTVPSRDSGFFPRR
jgi:hypothetical protein